jgi:futalosine hydrolase
LKTRGEARTLFVAATILEAERIVSYFGCALPSVYGPPIALTADIDILITGVGSGATGFSLGRWMDPARYDTAFQFGICGTFREDIALGSVVRIGADGYSDLGAETDLEPISLFEMGLLRENDFPYEGGRVLASSSVPSVIASIPEVAGVTVQRVLSKPESIAYVRRRYSPDVVTMESATFMFSCRLLGIEGFGLRSVSDRVGPRDKSTWRIDEAVVGITEVMKMVALAVPCDRRPTQ